MKKVSLFVLKESAEDALTKLRRTGLVHIEIKEGSGERVACLQEDISCLEAALYSIGKKDKRTVQKKAGADMALEIARECDALEKEKKTCFAEIATLDAHLSRYRSWGETDPEKIKELALHGIRVLACEMPRDVYAGLGDEVKTVVLKESKSTVRCALISTEGSGEIPSELLMYAVQLGDVSSVDMKKRMGELDVRIKEIGERLAELSGYSDSLRMAVDTLSKELEFQSYASGMASESLCEDKSVSLCYFTGFIEADKLDVLKKIAAESSWGLTWSDPCAEDDAPTKLKNNKFVSLIYPLTDFLGTVPGYFEYDISGWFLGFILIFFGIIFGDGGYGLLILAAACIPIIKALLSGKTPSAAFLLVGLFGISTVVWGTLTCTWFGLLPEQLPRWLCNLSVPFISNVYADRIWHPFWTSGDIGLTTSQNLQIVCFTLALVQLIAAHIIGAKRNIRSLKVLGDIGSALQLLGMYYVVLSFVVNPEVFGMGLVIGGIPVGVLSVSLVGVGFLMSFIFSNYAGSVTASVKESLKNIVSVLLGVVNVFSDIVSYIRLWAVGLAGAAISATVNDLAGPMLGNFMFMILAIILLVFGHGLNMILNVLSVIVHGIRLNTLEFSSHLDMSWSGHKFKPFEE